MADWLGPAKQTFYVLDDDGNLVPAVGYKIYHYVPGGDVAKSTWQDPLEAALNTNPVVLDANGQAQIFGNGLYRQVMTDPDGIGVGVTVFDEETAAGVYQAYFSLKFEFLSSTPPGANQVLGAAIFDRTCTIPSNFDGTDDGDAKAWGYQFTPPADSAYEITVSRGTVGSLSVTTCGTITIAQTTGLWTFATTDGDPLEFDAGEFIKFVGEATADSALLNLFWTINGRVNGG